MEETFKTIAETTGLVLEVVVVLIVFAGGVRAVLGLARATLMGRLGAGTARVIWIHYATAILLALEFALGADIIRTAVAPTWSDIGQLAAIATIRTGLGYFLSRDIDEFREIKAGADPALET